MLCRHIFFIPPALTPLTDGPDLPPNEMMKQNAGTAGRRAEHREAEERKAWPTRFRHGNHNNKIKQLTWEILAPVRVAHAT